MNHQSEVSQYFICPISLQIMKDPVTTSSGITYDRESIEHWLSTTGDFTCPVTKQPLSRDSDDLTPNHMLRRLIQSYFSSNSNNNNNGKCPFSKSHVLQLIRDLEFPESRIKALKRMEELAEESQQNRSCMAEGVVKSMVVLIVRCFKEGSTSGLEEGLKILHLVWNSSTLDQNKKLVEENFDLIIESLLWVLNCDNLDNPFIVKTHAVLVLKMVIEVVGSNFLENLKVDFFKEILKGLRIGRLLSRQAVKAALHVLSKVCLLGRNRFKIVEAGAVFDLIELELTKPEKKVTELVFCLLADLCSIADGRDQLLRHAGGVALVAKRLLRVSPATDDQAVQILGLVSKFSATREVVMEMLRVGAVSKLCMVLQADSATYLKNKARGALRLHSSVWNNSPCIEVYLLTKDPR